jgi:nitroreductase
MIKDEVSYMNRPAAPSSRPGAVSFAAAAKRLVSYWNESRLRAAEAKSGTVRATPGVVPWRTALEDVLKVGYGAQTQSRFIAGAWELIRWRTTPSAGALYPFEVIVSVLGEANYLWDLDRGVLVPCGPAPIRDDVAEAGISTPAGHHLEALLIFLARPWLSMRKYRLRGYAYCHLDVGHVATNLALYTTALGYAPTVHLRFSPASLSESLKLDGLCRLPLAVLSFAGPGPAAEPEPSAGSAPSVLELPEPAEIANWESLRGLIALEPSLEPLAPATAPLVAEQEGASGERLVPLPSARSPFLAARDWRSAILARRSAKGFRDEPLTAGQIGEVLSALQAQGLRADCAPEGAARMGVRLVARKVDGLCGVYGYSLETHGLWQIDGQADDPRPACMQQDIAGEAAALLILHAPVGSLLEQEGYSAFAEVLFHAAQIGQRLHLAASRIGTLGMTCIGGFDGFECASLARLEAGEEAVYVILLGVPNDAAFKYDQLGIAFSHGYTTREG